MIAAIDLGGTRTKVGLIRNGKIIAAEHCDAEATGRVAAHLDLVARRLDALAAARGLCLRDCRGIGLLSTGLVDNIAMRVLSTNGKYDDAVDFDFKTWARQAAGLELRMDNDARGALLGEWMVGAAKGCRNVVMMTLGTGVGTAVICQGRPLVGPNFSAGILGGHIIVNSGGRRCTCGAVGCLEAEASGWALSAIVQSRADRRDSALSDCEPLGLKELFLHAARGDALARELRDRFVTLWGEAIVSYVHLFDPEKVVVGGGLMQDAEVLVSFRRTVQQLAWRRNGEVPIVAACYPNDAGLLGAAALFEGLPAGALEPCPQ